MQLMTDIGRMDWGLLRMQKEALVGLKTGSTVTAEENEAIEGILSLIDAIQDRAVDSGQVEEADVFES